MSYSGRDRRTLWDFFDKDTDLLHEGFTSKGAAPPKTITLEVKISAYELCVYACAQLCPAIWTLWTIARQAPLFMGFPRQEYQGGLSFPYPGDLSDPGIEPTSPALTGKFFATVPAGKPYEV